MYANKEQPPAVREKRDRAIITWFLDVDNAADTTPQQIEAGVFAVTTS